ncbi:2-phosphosulfolactate phosphatase [Nocardia africana]|uniref:Probable 2-phosphosulfolactate phosphatase n=1 Tax=Nocardia africana TaxID=134964 RepID=A0ABW6NEK4_9NOCA
MGTTWNRNLQLQLWRPHETSLPCAATGAIVIDLFRATSTLQILVDSGHEVTIAATPGEANTKLRDGWRGVGEWHGETPTGFVSGNSPRLARHLQQVGPPIVFLSSNGAGAIRAAARNAAHVLLGNLWNISMLADIVMTVSGLWLLVPAGLRGQRSAEDDLMCSMLAAEIGVAVTGLSSTGSVTDLKGYAENHLPHDLEVRADIDFILSSSYKPSRIPVYRDGLIVGLPGAEFEKLYRCPGALPRVGSAGCG